MKYISFAIPCYNSEAYMANAVESILKGGEDVEIIIVNDGSKDRTSEIAHEFEAKYPTIIKAVDKENGGHGDAVNTGLEHATGKYFKVVDSDDWVNEEALCKILEVLKKFETNNEEIDMLISNYVYEKEGMEHKKVIEYRNVLPQEAANASGNGHRHLRLPGPVFQPQFRSYRGLAGSAKRSVTPLSRTVPAAGIGVQKKAAREHCVCRWCLAVG